MTVGPLEVFLREPRTLLYFATWPVFSLTSYELVVGLKRQGIRPGTIIDVGANVGQFAVAWGKLLPGTSIIAFEPLPECYAKLQRNLAGVPNAVLHNCALGKERGRVDFHVNLH